MPDLILDSLEIRNFRGLRDLRIDHLGRVNLIVGANNVGKTSVLEALRLYANPASAGVVLDLLATRDEISLERESPGRMWSGGPPPLESLFVGDKVIPSSTPIRIGRVNGKSTQLAVSLGFYDLKARTLGKSWTAAKTKRDHPSFDTKSEASPDLRICLVFQIGRWKKILTLEQIGNYSMLDLPNLFSQSGSGATEKLVARFVHANGLDPSEVDKLWDSIALTTQEKDVIDALNIISPEVERLVLKPNYEEFPGRLSSARRVPFVKVKGFDAPVPLRSLGDGLNRLFGIALALVHARDGLLLVDEIENGIHYSVQLDMWRLIFRTAQRLNVQVFATSHSWDSIEAFQKAADENKEAEGVLVRLSKKGDEVRVAHLDERDLGIAIRGAIEVR